MKSDQAKKGVERAPHRALFKAIGYTDEEIKRPLIGIANAVIEDNTVEGIKRILKRLAHYQVERLVMEATGRYEFELAQLARATVEPATSTGCRWATGVSVPVRPT